MGRASGVTWLLSFVIGAVMFLLGAIIAIGARPRPEDAAVARDRREVEDNGGG